MDGLQTRHPVAVILPIRKGREPTPQTQQYSSTLCHQLVPCLSPTAQPEQPLRAGANPETDSLTKNDGCGHTRCIHSLDGTISAYASTLTLLLPTICAKIPAGFQMQAASQLDHLAGGQPNCSLTLMAFCSNILRCCNAHPPTDVTV